MVAHFMWRPKKNTHQKSGSQAYAPTSNKNIETGSPSLNACARLGRGPGEGPERRIMGDERRENEGSWT
ncbi:MAG: hypothetical protein OKBPIBMD_01069 [Chlorobi bacterium]|nr:hypothetical protein [Chlorobiota bacterium]